MLIKEKIKNDQKLYDQTFVCYNLMIAALQDEFAEMLDLDDVDRDTFDDIVVDTCNYLKTKVKKTIARKIKKMNKSI